MENDRKKVIFSGIKPTGDLTLGSYLGAIKNWIKLQDDYNCVYCIVDMHSITVREEPSVLRKRSIEQLAQYIAAGLDYNKSVLFIQSHVPAHAELSWILGCYTMFGELSRMTQFKDKSAKNADNINAGLFTYPVLMAADILLYQADLVPVGEDQKQHVEITRDIAGRFNGIYGNTFTIPEPYIPKVGARIMSLASPANKMSKSEEDAGGSILLLDKPEDIMRKFKRAVTDSGRDIVYDRENKPGISNLLEIYASTQNITIDKVVNEFCGKSYGELKPAVGEAVVELLRPLREKTEDLLKDKVFLESIYKAGAEKASAIASRTLNKVKHKVGFVTNK